MILTNINKPEIKIKSIISKEIAILSIVLFVSFAFMYFGVAQLYREVKIIKLETELKEKNLASKKSLLSGVTKFGNGDRKVDDESLEKIDNLISSGNNFEDYAAHIIKLAYGKDVLVSDFSFSEDQKKPEAENGKFKERTITFSASGGFSNFMHFIDSVENAIPFAQEESIIIKGEGSGAGGSEKPPEYQSPILKFEVSLKFYYY